MSEKIELVSFHLCPYVQRSAIVLAEKHIPFERINIDLAAKPDWFKKISPLGKVPLLKTEGEALFESAVICEYLDEVTPGSLHPSDPLAKARHRSWIEFGSSILNYIGGFYNAKDAEALGEKIAVIRRKFELLEAELSGEGPFFAGRDFAMIDAVYGPVFRYFDVFEEIDDFGFFTGLEKLSSWRENLQARASVREAVAPDYPARLMAFLERRNSYLSRLIEQQKRAA